MNLLMVSLFSPDDRVLDNAEICILQGTQENVLRIPRESLIKQISTLCDNQSPTLAVYGTGD